MKKVTIIKNGSVAYGPAFFETQEQADAWIKSNEDKGDFGKKEHWKNAKDCTYAETHSAIASEQRDSGQKHLETWCQMPPEWKSETEVTDGEIAINVGIEDRVSTKTEIYRRLPERKKAETSCTAEEKAIAIGSEIILKVKYLIIPERWKKESLLTADESSVAAESETREETISTRYYLIPGEWKRKAECTEKEIASAVASEDRPTGAPILETYYKLPAEYQVVITDYEIPKEEKVMMEYSRISESLEALLQQQEGKSELLTQVMEKRKAIREKYGM